MFNIHFSEHSYKSTIITYVLMKTKSAWYIFDLMYCIQILSFPYMRTNTLIAINSLLEKHLVNGIHPNVITMILLCVE